MAYISLTKEKLHHPATISKACCEYVREIKHSNDYRLNPVTQNRYCYANSHLLAALLRANGIPAGFYYTRFSSDTIP